MTIADLARTSLPNARPRGPEDGVAVKALGGEVEVMVGNEAASGVYRVSARLHALVPGGWALVDRRQLEGMAGHSERYTVAVPKGATRLSFEVGGYWNGTMTATAIW